MIRFGKSAGPLLAHKQAFFSENDALLAEGRRIGDVYTDQPLRQACKCCDGQLDGARFTKQGIDYVVCARCGHLTGVHEDTAEFCAAVYVDDEGAKYARNYAAADRAAYQARVRDIYHPKAVFLCDALNAAGEDSKALAYADFGAGSGYFVAALRALGNANVKGYEVSAAQIALAAAMIEPGAVVHHALDEAVALAGRAAADVVSMVGVLEHVQRPRQLLAAFRDNPQVRYVFLSVPLFSPCVMLEAVFPDVFQRQLSAGHTHLYTEQSIDWTCREFGLERAAEWWFGTDMVDLFRAVTVELERREETRSLSEHWGRMIAPALDDAQLAFDRRKTASEVHMLLRFRDKGRPCGS